MKHSLDGGKWRFVSKIKYKRRQQELRAQKRDQRGDGTQQEFVQGQVSQVMREAEKGRGERRVPRWLGICQLARESASKRLPKPKQEKGSMTELLR